MNPPRPLPTRRCIRLHGFASGRAASSLKLRYRRFVTCWPIQLGPRAADCDSALQRIMNLSCFARIVLVFLLIGAVAPPGLAQAPSPAGAKRIPAEVAIVNVPGPVVKPDAVGDTNAPAAVVSTASPD